MHLSASQWTMERARPVSTKYRRALPVTAIPAQRLRKQQLRFGRIFLTLPLEAGSVSTTQMILSSSTPSTNSHLRARRILPVICSAWLLCGLFAVAAPAQRTFRKIYDTRSDVRLDLDNLAGSVRVEVWQQPKIEVKAEMEKAVRLEPTLTPSGLVIDVLRDNGGMRGDMGIVNFYIRVPVNSSVALKTKMGNITVSGVQGNFVRASVTLDGDIELIGINVNTVMASTLMGNIFFNGALHNGGNYRLESRQGDIGIRIPSDSRFNLVATAPYSRRIEPGPFARFITPGGDGRRMAGAVAGGGAMLTVTNTHGTISFLR